ncbi:MAG TPA: HAMP domain-containing sensor histidine kinase [Gemmatimonadales bacterium]|nr:HAMP domain-containing sensor histidine kinase [Gemmatimonadales bacterium]
MLTRAIRRIKARWSETSDAPADLAARAPILAAVALAVDRGDASCIDAPARPSLRLTMHLVDLLQDELLTLWRSGECSPGYVLPTVDRLRRVRTDLESRLQQLPGAPLAGYDGFDFLIEFVHDMRSPLSSLQMLADRLHRGWSGPLNELQLRQLRLMYAATHALNTVTMNALQLTRACTQLEEPEARPFSVMRLLSEVEDIVGALAIQKGLEINFIPPKTDRRRGHPIELQRILLNLVTNALKFTRAGSVTVSATDQEQDRLEFAVQDTGPGIPPDAQGTLFQPFHRSGDSGPATFSATGLGLAITQRLVRALGGQLQYETALGKGTRFYFVLDLPVP